MFKKMAAKCASTPFRGGGYIPDDDDGSSNEQEPEDPVKRRKRKNAENCRKYRAKNKKLNEGLLIQGACHFKENKWQPKKYPG